MTTVGSFAAKTHLPELLERVSQGETILITRRGKPVAMLVPPPAETTSSVAEVIAALKELHRGNTLDGIPLRELIDEGRRF